MTCFARNRHSVLPVRVLGLLISFALAAWGQAGHGPLPVYLEDNHAGTFQFLATTLDLTQPCALVLVDAHPDSTRPGAAESIRERIARVDTPGEREARTQALRRGGTIQAFDWIVPLMPRPVAKVIWVRPAGSSTGVPGALPPGYALADADSFEARIPAHLPVVVSIDLDFFTGRPASVQAAAFSRIWAKVLRLPRLQAVSFAISRPWLTDDAEASRLVGMALNGALSLAHASIRFEPFGLEGPDRSLRAKAFYRERREPPRFDPESVSPELRSLLMANASRLEVRLDPARWEDLLGRWRAENSDWRIAMEGTEPGSDGVLRPGAGAQPDLHLEGGSPGLIRHVNWIRWTPKAWSYNVLPELPSGKVFAGAAPPVMDYEPSLLARTETATLPAEAWMGALPYQGEAGVLRLSAELETDDGPGRAARVEIRRAVGTGFHAGLSEQFGLPYVFGAGFLRRAGWRGPDTGVGNDCANFLVQAWRRSGLRMPWCNPAQLRRQLTPVAARVRCGDRLAVPGDAGERGLVIHMGSHVAALWEDREPIGTLGPEDLVAHHLGGAPEVVALGELLGHRRQETFDVYLGPARQVTAWIAVGGDVMPGEEGAPPDGLVGLLAKADLAVANLETTAGEGGRAVAKRYVFRIAASRLTAVKGLGVQAVALANNHVGDYGAEGFRGTLAALDAAGLGHFGGGSDTDSAVGAWYGRVKGLTVAFLAVTLVDPSGLPAGEHQPGVAVLPRHAREIAQALAEARKRASCVIVVPHWGDEGTAAINEDQRRWARWLIEAGADAVAGSGPHVLQMEETIGGAPVCYSLGNLWFRGAWPKESRRAGVLLLGLDGEGRVVASRVESR